MPVETALSQRPRAEQIAALRAELAFGIDVIDGRLADHRLDGAGLHEIAAATSALGDDAAATLFAAGIAARFADRPGFTVL